MYINERKGYEKETAMLIEEFLRQRIQGMKNKSGKYVTQAFPKLIYVLDSDNIEPDGKYFWLTKLAARCTARRMNPDYVSAKIMKEYKGSVFPSMAYSRPHNGKPCKCKELGEGEQVLWTLQSRRSYH